MQELDRDQMTLLLYLEDCCVNKSGVYDLGVCNGEDVYWLNQWAIDGFVQLHWGAGGSNGKRKTSFVVLTEEAWEIAHKERRARANRSVLPRWEGSKAEVNLGYESDEEEGV